MATRTLEVALCGTEPNMDSFGSDASCRVSVHRGPATRQIAESHHLVITIGATPPSAWSDVSIATPAELQTLVEERLRPWTAKWTEGRRAPRAQVAMLADPDPTWAATAARLIARLEFHTHAEDVLRIDHIGSTSVPGLAAKNLIDIQVTIPKGVDPVSVAQSATNAGFVHVKGEWFGKDRVGDLHPEQVCVDADPGRPVNVNIRASDNPVARDALLFRDWLRANDEAKNRYLKLKSELAGRQVDDYGDSKEPFISAALHEAETWAAHTGWTFAAGSGG